MYLTEVYGKVSHRGRWQSVSQKCMVKYLTVVYGKVSQRWMVKCLTAVAGKVSHRGRW